MPFFDLEDRLEDIRDAINDVEKFIAGKSFDDYMADKLCRRAVERSVGIISEASRHIPDEQKSRHNAIPWRRVAGVGNVLSEMFLGTATSTFATMRFGALQIRNCQR